MTPNTQYYFDHSDSFAPYQTAVGDQSFAVALTRKRDKKGSQMVDPKNSQFIVLLGVKYGPGGSKVVWKTRADWRKMCSFQLGHMRKHAAVLELMGKLKQAEDIAEQLNKRIVDQTSAANAERKAKDERVRQAQDEKNEAKAIHDAAQSAASARMDKLEAALSHQGGLLKMIADGLGVKAPKTDDEITLPEPEPEVDPTEAPALPSHFF
jgi:hypothetical protein